MAGAGQLRDGRPDQVGRIPAVAQRPATFEPAVERHPLAASGVVGEGDVERLALDGVALHRQLAAAFRAELRAVALFADLLAVVLLLVAAGLEWGGSR